MSLEKEPKATTALVPTERRYGWKTADEHCNREAKDGVNTFPEHFQGSASEGRIGPCNTIMNSSLGRLDGIMVAFQVRDPPPTCHQSDLS